MLWYMKEAIRAYIVLFNLYEVSRIGKSIGTEYSVMFAKGRVGMGGGE